ncbi:MAG: alpha-mannosidase, partial [Kiritimatiellia bacterium]
PHTGDLIRSDVQAQAIQLNQPPALFAGFALGETAVPITVDGEGVALEVLKKAEKEECLVVRLVERFGRDTTATVTLSDEKATLTETDLMEWNTIATLGRGRIEIPMKPFEIRTFKIL